MPNKTFNTQQIKYSWMLVLWISLLFEAMTAREVAASQLEEVVVTATKWTESLRDIPASITHFNGDRLEEQGKLNLADFIQETPGVVLNSSAPGFMRVSIRGVGIDNSPDSAIPSPVGVLIGDTSFTDPYIASITPDLSAFDLRSIEVLKGPQGTVFGGAALSGAIRYVLSPPDLSEMEAKGFSQYTDPTYGESGLSTGIAANLPIVEDKLAIRIGYIDREYPGVFDNKRSGSEDVNRGNGEQRRAIIQWEPKQSLDFRLTHLDQEYQVNDGLFLADNRDERSSSRYLLSQPGNHDFSLDSLEISYDFETFSVMSLTSKISKNVYAFSDVSATFSSPPPYATEASAVFSYFNHDSNAVSQELRFQSIDDWWVDWIAGIYSFRYEMKFDIYVNSIIQDRLISTFAPFTTVLNGSSDIRGESSLLYAFNNARAEEDAIFVDLKKNLFSRLQLSLGARYYETEVKGGFTGMGVLARAANNGEAVSIYEQIPENGISPRFSIKYDISDDYSVYVQGAKGFRFGGLQNIPPSEMEGVPATYRSDKIWSYEIGLRTAWLENTIQFDVVAFTIDYKDPQIQQKTATTQLNFVDNVGAAKSDGYELNLIWQAPIDGLKLSLSGGEVNARTTEDFKDANGNLIKAGTQMPGAADSHISTELSFFGTISEVTYAAYVSYNYIGKSFGDLAKTEAVNDYGTLNGGISLVLNNFSIRPTIAINVANINNESAPIGGSSRILGTGEKQSSFTFNSPRTLNVRLSFEL